MNHTSVVAIIKYRWKVEHRIEHTDKHLSAAHQIGQSLYIMKYRPRIVPAVSFGKGIPPLERIKRSLEGAIGVLATHQFCFRVEQVAVVLASALIEFQFFCRTP